MQTKINDLKIIKKFYGEQFQHLARKLFPTMLDKYPGELSKIILANFSKSRVLYEDIKQNHLENEFASYIYSFIDNDSNNVKIPNVTPQKLMRKAGYTLYECKSEADIQSFSKYYAPSEKLCSFYVDRINSCHVFFAIKDNAELLKREDFLSPERQDEYGTSVISIQFTRDKSNILSIKNRYNYSVDNPDSTFSNNLDNIIPGLTESFYEYYGLKEQHIKENLEIPGYIKVNNGKYYKYNYKINNIYYCNNAIIDNLEAIEFAKEKYIIIDYFILDLVNKKIYLYDNKIDDSFAQTIKDIKNIIISNTSYGKKIIITTNNEERIVLHTNKNNEIVGLKNNHITDIKNSFLSFNKSIQTLKLASVKSIGNSFLENNESLEKVYLPNVEIIGNSFIKQNKNISKLEMSKVKTISNDFLFSNQSLKAITLPSLREVGNNFLKLNTDIESANMDNLQIIGKNFMYSNNRLLLLYLPNALSIDDNFLYWNESVKELRVPSLKYITSVFLYNNN